MARPISMSRTRGYQAVIEIRTLEIKTGRLPRRALDLVLDWAELHQDELLVNWRQIEQGRPISTIEPLRNESLFRRVAIDEETGAVCWPDGPDLAPDAMYSRLAGRPIFPEPAEDAEAAQSDPMTGMPLSPEK
jgi:Domain of unknown function (DUF4160)/Protein of unknown function (DUF2442)